MISFINKILNNKSISKFFKLLERFIGTNLAYIFYSGSWLITNKAVDAILGLLVLIIFAKFASKEVFGTYQYIISVAGLLSIFSLPGIDTALVRTVSKGNEKMLTVCFKEKLKWSLVGSIISLFLAIWYFFNQNIQLSSAFFIVAFFLPLANSLSIFPSFWQGKKRFDIQSKYSIIYNFLASVFLIISILIFKNNLIFIILSFFIGYTIGGLIFYLQTLKKISNEKTEIETISFGKHLTMMLFIGFIASYIDKVMLWQFLGPTSIAIYYLAEKPVLSQKNIKEIKNVILDKFYKLFLITSLVVIIYITVSPIVFKILFKNYTDSILYSQILSLTILTVPFTLLTASFTAELRKKELYLINFITPISKIISFMLLIPFLGIWGLVISNLISNAIHNLLTIYFFKRI
jgi:O-antigen/teichoic acid export membrane protein